MTNKEAVRVVLANAKGAMRVSEVREALTTIKPMHNKPISDALWRLEKQGIVEKVGHGIYRITGESAQPNQQTFTPPDTTGLSGREAVFRILAYTKKPMNRKAIDEWIRRNDYEPLTQGQIAGAFYVLLNNYRDVIEKTANGTYRIHSKWNGESLEEQTATDGKATSGPSGPSVPKKGDKKVSVVIPCYGICWDRNLVDWGPGRELLGNRPGEDEDAVNFADQMGVYVLYQWPRVNYVGQTERGHNLYGRLKDHVTQNNRGRWDKFSWFGLTPVGQDGRLGESASTVSIRDQVTMMETVLISTLAPPFNNTKGNGLGKEYEQVLSPEVEAREHRQLAAKIRGLLGKV